MAKKASTEIVKLKPQSASSIMRTVTKTIEQGFAQLSELLSRDLSPADAAAAYLLVNETIKKPIADIAKMTRDSLIEFVDENGDFKNEDGKTKVVKAGSYRLERQVSLKKDPDEAELRAYLKTKGIDPSTVFDTVVTYVLNPTKLQQLVTDGKVDAQTVEQMRPVHNVRLIVKEG